MREYCPGRKIYFKGWSEERRICWRHKKRRVRQEGRESQGPRVQKGGQLRVRSWAREEQYSFNFRSTKLLVVLSKVSLKDEKLFFLSFGVVLSFRASSYPHKCCLLTFIKFKLWYHGTRQKTILFFFQVSWNIMQREHVGATTLVKFSVFHSPAKYWCADLNIVFLSPLF